MNVFAPSSTSPNKCARPQSRRHSPKTWVLLPASKTSRISLRSSKRGERR
ncbi:hypothetical protein BC938DRAFT_483615 [Jimgerdemannia flammicorona]|uniref:Uncharacterized protein n=1 Tax=Jimgerdemannia flammicorona TaxID=994334 RepID=A0A433QBS6_9FUNG|nr:hypothetical protein BC938DRAFT_483615 [Jimgerdemannia flammicorona]